MSKIGFIGAGNMAFALAEAFSKSKQSHQFYYYDPDPARVALFQKNFANSDFLPEPLSVAQKSDYLILAVKPQVSAQALAGLESVNSIVISIMAGIPIRKLQKLFPEGSIVRVMPNAPCMVGSMAAGCSFSESFPVELKESVLELLSNAGMAVEVDESLMDGVTALSGSGPAFAAYIIESFINAGIEEGLSSRQSRDLAIATFKGTAQMLLDKKMDPAELIKIVSSPNGTTVAGRAVLEKSDIPEVVSQTVAAAARRSRELANE